MYIASLGIEPLGTHGEASLGGSIMELHYGMGDGGVPCSSESEPQQTAANMRSRQ